MVFSEYDFSFDPKDVSHPSIGEDEHETTLTDINIKNFEKDLQLLS